MARPADPTEDSVPRWTAGAVAARVGVAPATLRSWSRRHGVGPAGHRAGSYRRYTDTDVAELQTMRRLSDDGMALASAAAVARRRHRGDTPEVPARSPVAHDVAVAEVRALVQAAQRLDADVLVDTLEASLRHRDVTTTWNGLCRPGLDALDDPSSAANCQDGALVLARAIATSLHRRPAPAAVPGARRVLLTCAPGEHHTLALDVLSAALGDHGIPAPVLGPAAPMPAILHAVERTRPLAVFVWAQRSATARPASLRRLVPHAVTVAAGPGCSATRLPAEVRRIDTLDDAVNLARHSPATELESV